MSALRYTLILAGIAMLGGCASNTINQQRTYVDQFAQKNLGASAVLHQTGGDATIARQRAEKLLDAPLAMTGAVELALSHSPAFQGALAEATAESANAVQSARLPNPVFTFERLKRNEGGSIDLDIGRMLSASLLDILLLPNRIAVAEAAGTQARVRAASSAVATATEARQAWVRAVAAAQSLHYAEQVMAASEASAELAKRMYQTGNFSKLQRARQQAFHADATVQLLQAERANIATREALVRALGLDSALASKLALPPRLPDLPATPIAETTLTAQALEQRLDVQMSKAELDVIGKRYGIDTATSYVNALHLAGVRNSETGKPPQRGYEVEIALPVFDTGDARRISAQATYLAALNRAAQTAVDATSQVREQYAAYRKAHDLAQMYRTEIVPLRKLIADEMLLKYNGMLTGVFDLLAETRAQIASVRQAIDAERDFWLADASLAATMLGRPTAAPMAEAAPMTSAAAAH